MKSSSISFDMGPRVVPVDSKPEEDVYIALPCDQGVPYLLVTSEGSEIITAGLANWLVSCGVKCREGQIFHGKSQIEWKRIEIRRDDIVLDGVLILPVTQRLAQLLSAARTKAKLTQTRG